MSDDKKQYLESKCRKVYKDDMIGDKTAAEMMAIMTAKGERRRKRTRATGGMKSNFVVG